MEQALYKLPDGWEWHSVKKLSHNIQYGHTAKAESNGNAKFLRITDIQNGKIDWQGVPTVSLEEKEISKYALNDDDLIFARSGATAGKSILIKNAPKDAVFASYLIRIVPNKKDIIPEYLRYFFLTPAYWEVVGQNAAGAAQPNINGTKLSEFIVPVAPQGEQKRIVEKLDALLTRIDTAIEHLQENLSTSKSLLASALFEKFHQEVNPTPIADIFNVHNGRAYKKPELLDSGKYKVIRIQNLKGGENYYYSDLELDENKYCESGDLLFSWSGTPGTSFGAFIWNDEKAIYHYHIWKMEPKVEIASRYAYWVLKDITEEAIANARGVAGMLHITKGTMESFIVSLPSYEAQQKIAKELDALALKSEQLQAEISSKIDSLKHLKASILDSAFKGEL